MRSREKPNQLLEGALPANILDSINQLNPHLLSKQNIGNDDKNRPLFYLMLTSFLLMNSRSVYNYCIDCL